MRGTRLAWAAALLLVLGCGRDATGPATPAAGFGARASTGSDDPTFVTASASAPPMANPVIAFTAVKGQSYAVQMVYAAPPGQHAEVFLTFKLDAQSLAYLPDGSPIADGQAVPITLTLIDPVHLVVEFQPSGLRFSPDHPAELRMSYAEATPQDTALTAQLRIWKRESALDPWQLVPTTPLLGDAEVEAQLQGFTSYGIAY